METSYSQEREELERVLRSGNFPRAPLQGKLLKYICEEFFAGRSDRVKEYILATEVFGRGEGFDQNQDAIVRVEAHRLRKNLKEYYQGEGRNDLVQIVVEPGRYVPKFVTREPTASVKTDAAAAPAGKEGASAETAVPNVKRSKLWRSLAIVAGIGCVAIITGTLLRRNTHSRSPDLLAPANESSSPTSTASAGPDAVRILAGYTRGEYIDRLGEKWTSDRYYSGGESDSRPQQFIERAADSRLYEQWRHGVFSYDIPLKQENYELHLYFMEPEFGPDAPHGGGETSRMFDVLVDGKPLLDQFDILGDVGRNDTADEWVFTGIHPSSDGRLHLHFAKEIDDPIVCAIELLSCSTGKMRPVRIIATGSSYTDHDGHIWLPDRYFEGGRSADYKVSIRNSPDRDLYLSQRFGYFNYSIPVAAGSKYAATLHFAEVFFGPGNPGRGGIDSRVFDVYCNGTVLLRNFDIFKEAGGENRALAKTFHGLVPNAQGKLVLNFVPVRNYACLNAIEVAPE